MKAVWAAALLVMGRGVARADALFDLTLQQVGPVAPPGLSARLFATDLGSMPFGSTTLETYRVTGAMGQVDGVAITGVSDAGVDNLLTVDEASPGFAALETGDGLGLTLVDGHVISLIAGRGGVEIFSDPQDLSFSYGVPVGPVIEPEAATPEPGTMGLVGTGVLGVVGMVRRRVRG